MNLASTPCFEALANRDDDVGDLGASGLGEGGDRCSSAFVDDRDLVLVAMEIGSGGVDCVNMKVGAELCVGVAKAVSGADVLLFLLLVGFGAYVASAKVFQVRMIDEALGACAMKFLKPAVEKVAHAAAHEVVLV